MYENKCSKCGRDFETKNPKRVICPNCLYPDRAAPAGPPSQGDSGSPEDNAPRGQNVESGQMNYPSDRGGDDRPQGDRGSFNRDDRGGYGGGRQGGYGGGGDRGGYGGGGRQGGYGGGGDRGGYSGGGRQGGYQGGGGRGGYQGDRGGYGGDRGGYGGGGRSGGYQGGGGRSGGYQGGGGRSGGYQGGGGRSGGYQGGGGRSGGYQGGGGRSGGYQGGGGRSGGYQGGGGRSGGYQGGGGRSGGYQGGGRQGGYQGGGGRSGGYQGGGGRQGGYQRGGGRPGGFQGGGGRGGFNRGRPERKPLLVSKEQLAQIEELYRAMLPLPNPDVHDTIGAKIDLEGKKVFFGLNLIRQKMRLPKLPFPKRRLAVSVDQLDAVRTLYEPLLPLPPIGCHKIIAKQLKMDEWRVHVAIGIIRKQMELPRWNPDREDAPEEFKNQPKEEVVEDKKVEADAEAEVAE